MFINVIIEPSIRYVLNNELVKWTINQFIDTLMRVRVFSYNVLGSNLMQNWLKNK